MSKEDFAKFSYRAWNPPDGDMYSYITALRVGAEFRFGIKDQLFPKFEGGQDSLKTINPVLLNQKTVAPVLLNKKPVVPKGKVAKKLKRMKNLKSMERIIRAPAIEKLIFFLFFIFIFIYV